MHFICNIVWIVHGSILLWYSTAIIRGSTDIFNKSTFYAVRYFNIKNPSKQNIKAFEFFGTFGGLVLWSDYFTGKKIFKRV